MGIGTQKRPSLQQFRPGLQNSNDLRSHPPQTPPASPHSCPALRALRIDLYKAWSAFPQCWANSL